MSLVSGRQCGGRCVPSGLEPQAWSYPWLMSLTGWCHQAPQGTRPAKGLGALPLALSPDSLFATVSSLIAQLTKVKKNTHTPYLFKEMRFGSLERCRVPEIESSVFRTLKLKEPPAHRLVLHVRNLRPREHRRPTHGHTAGQV